MGGGDELAVWKCLFEIADDFPLPLWMQMKVDLINQNDGVGARKRIIQSRVGLRKTFRDIQDERQNAALAVRQLAHIKGCAVDVYLNS